MLEKCPKKIAVTISFSFADNQTISTSRWKNQLRFYCILFCVYGKNFHWCISIILAVKKNCLSIERNSMPFCQRYLCCVLCIGCVHEKFETIWWFIARWNKNRMAFFMPFCEIVNDLVEAAASNRVTQVMQLRSI